MAKIKNDSSQRLLDGVCHLTGHRIFPNKGCCERCRRSIVYYSVSLNQNYLVTTAQIFTSSKLVINLDVYGGDLVEVTALSLKGKKYIKFHKKLKVRKPRKIVTFKF